MGLLNALKSQYPQLNILSGYRDPSHNARVGGAKHSQHTHGNAIDISLQGLDDQTRTGLLDLAANNGARGYGIYASGNSLHLDTRDTPAVWGMLPNAPYKGHGVDLAPQWAQGTLARVMGQQMPQQATQMAQAQTAPSAPQQAQQMPTQEQQAPMDILPNQAQAAQGLLASLSDDKKQSGMLGNNSAGLLASLMQQQEQQPVQWNVPLPWMQA
jgi:hypothetical protein